VPGSVFARSLHDARKAFLWWTLGLTAYVALIAAVWPSVRDNPALVRLHEAYPEALKAFVSFGGEFDLSTAAGYLGAELFSLIVPLLLLVASIGGGARALAGEEEQGTLDLLLSQPVSRGRVALEKLAALCLEVIALGGVLWFALWIGARAANMSISGAHLFAGTADAVLLALGYGAVAMLVGAATGRRAPAIALSTALVVAAYLLNALAPLVGLLHSIRWASPWYHYTAEDPLRHGVAANSLVLVGILVVAIVLLPAVFERRDLTS
jgi:beta-exotoxin I transport system permease protein